MSKLYWKTKEGKKIDIDDMSESHLRNTLKMIVRNTNNKRDELNRIADFEFDHLNDDNFNCHHL